MGIDRPNAVTCHQVGIIQTRRFGIHLKPNQIGMPTDQPAQIFGEIAFSQLSAARIGSARATVPARNLRPVPAGGASVPRRHRPAPPTAHRRRQSSKFAGPTLRSPATPTKARPASSTVSRSAAADNDCARWRAVAPVGGHQQQQAGARRFFQRFQQAVGGIEVEAVGRFQQGDLVTAILGGIAKKIAEFADLIDLMTLPSSAGRTD
jgi:hypothetical protein